MLVYIVVMQIHLTRTKYHSTVARYNKFTVVALTLHKQIKTGPDFRQKAELEGCFLRDVMDRLGNAGALASQDSDSQDILTMLYHMTYVHGMVEVELYWPANQDTPTPTVSLGAGDKSLLTDALTNEHREHVEGLARWVWNKRFQAGDQGHLIGLAILKELVSLATGACDGVAPRCVP
ncbi:hypothetical protein SARC_10222 [Sphaeroforma arctica JP610]|uniref:Uncharacterized protein n=1 Tax=Sphaeroforma arctica JP610 TaxID=667725 RepID=A0A0L0FKK5_9EUKA|nr:hypothetical protein SARC_10222 [Sphaeroforma arctica JP610]KNC77314.1 hypothetical protein SARC_10222 [Sphaeroforma arctica JP610]|eukprot:XP_014151216.1 hypothetical protein SARC_10222 [Sphaeroforma arctica JP610]